MDRLRDNTRLGRKSSAFRTALLFLLLLWFGWTMLRETADFHVSEEIDALKKEGFAACREDLAPPPIAAGENRALLYESAFSQLSDKHGGWSNDDLSALEPDEKKELLSELCENRSALELARRARGMEKCRFDRDYASGLFPKVPEAGSAIVLGRRLGFCAQLEMEKGRPDEALEFVRDLLALSDGYRDEPILVSQLVRVCLMEQAIRTVRLCTREALPEPEVRKWLAVLPDAGCLAGSMERAMRGELAGAACSLPRLASEMMMGAGQDRASFVYRSADPLFALCSLDGLRQYRRAAILCDMSFEKAQPLIRRSPRWCCDQSTGFDFLKMLAPSPGRVMERQAAVESFAALARAGLQFELIQRRSGTYPIQTFETDSFTGLPLIADPKAGLIRSAGPYSMDLGRLEEMNLAWRLNFR